MLIKPDLKDEKIITCLQDAYGLTVHKVMFLPIGADFNTAVYEGYTQTKINQDAIAYYRFERIIQDIADYCEYIFLSDEGGDDRMQCFEHLQPVFLPNGAIERAYDSYNTRKIL